MNQVVLKSTFLKKGLSYNVEIITFEIIKQLNMKTQLIQNVFKMMIGVSALIASTAFFINTISPVQASETKEVSFNSELPTKTEGMETSENVYVGCGSGIYTLNGNNWYKVGP
jgi:hypothetical protein